MGNNINNKGVIPPDAGLYEGVPNESIQEHIYPPSGLEIGFYDPNNLQPSGGYGPGTVKGNNPTAAPIPNGKTFTVRLPPNTITRETTLSNFSILTTISLRTPLTPQKVIAALQPLNILPASTQGSYIVVNITGFLIFISQQFPPQPGPQQFSTIHPWRTPNPVLLAVLTMEGDPNASSDLGFGFWIASGPRN